MRTAMETISEFRSKNKAFTGLRQKYLQKRSRVVAFRVTETEYAILKDLADSDDVTIGNYVSSVALTLCRGYRRCEKCQSRRGQ